MTVQRVAQIFGWIRPLVAIWGFFVTGGSMEVGPEAPAILGLFPVNVVHNLAHLILGIWGILAAGASAGRGRTRGSPVSCTSCSRSWEWSIRPRSD